jgi:hypothetical protein
MGDEEARQRLMAEVSRLVDKIIDEDAELLKELAKR